MVDGTSLGRPVDTPAGFLCQRIQVVPRLYITPIDGAYFMSGCRHGFTLLRVVVLFRYGCVLEAVVLYEFIIQLYTDHTGRPTPNRRRCKRSHSA